MRGYRDLLHAGTHEVSPEAGILLRFGEDGILWNPTEAEEAAMLRHPMRRQRFELVEVEAPQPPAAGAANDEDGQVGRGRRRRRDRSPEAATEGSGDQSALDERGETEQGGPAEPNGGTQDDP
jgi:hypothetical protein